MLEKVFTFIDISRHTLKYIFIKVLCYFFTIANFVEYLLQLNALSRLISIYICINIVEFKDLL